MATIDPSERTVSELRTDVREIDDPDDLREMREAEARGKDRKSAKEAIERQLRRIGEESSSEEADEDGSEGDVEEGEEADDIDEDRTSIDTNGSSGDDETGEDERGGEETLGTNVETTVVSASQRLDAIGTETEDESDRTETADADTETLNSGDSRGIGTGQNLGAIEPSGMSGADTESGAEGGEAAEDEDNTARNEAEGVGTEISRRSTGEDLRQRLSEFGASARSEVDEGDDSAREANGARDESGTEASEDETDEDETDEREEGRNGDESSVDIDESSESDESEDETRTDENEPRDDETDTTTETMSEAETGSETDRDAEPSDEPTAEDGSREGTDTSSEGEASLINVRDTVFDTAADLIGRRLDGISGIQRTDEGWSAIVNVIERRSVPDTQDILGRYEMTLDSSGEITGYHRLNRYRRGDTTQEEWQ